MIAVDSYKPTLEVLWKEDAHQSAISNCSIILIKGFMQLVF